MVERIEIVEVLSKLIPQPAFTTMYVGWKRQK